MKRTTLLLALACILFCSCSRNAEPAPTNENKNSEQTLVKTYRLYPTQNMWTFIKLNTRNGLMWQVQYSVNDDSQFEAVLNPTPFAPKDKETDGRFSLYPTQNMWTFILLDELDGRTWQVQWSIDAEKRFIIPINDKTNTNI